MSYWTDDDYFKITLKDFQNWVSKIDWCVYDHTKCPIDNFLEYMGVGETHNMMYENIGVNTSEKFMWTYPAPKFCTKISEFYDDIKQKMRFRKDGCIYEVPKFDQNMMNEALKVATGI